MNIQTSKLKDLLVLMKPVINKKATIKSIQHIKVADGKAIATDLAVMIITDLPEATEVMLLPYFALMDLVPTIPAMSIQIQAQEGSINLTWQGGTASLNTEDAADFPVPEDKEPTAEGDLDGGRLLGSMEAVMPYVATEESRPILTCVALQLGRPIEVAAGDGFRMAHQTLGMEFPSEATIAIPGPSVKALLHIADKTPRSASLKDDSFVSAMLAKRTIHLSLYGGEKARFNFDHTSVIINLAQGQPPQYLALIPKGEPFAQSYLFAPEFLGAVNRVKGIAKDGSGMIRLEFTKNQLTMSAQADEQKVVVTMDTVTDIGDGWRVAINYPYLLNFLAGQQGIFSIAQHTNGGPVSFDSGNNVKVLVMPMMAQWDGDAPAKTEEPATDTVENIEIPDAPVSTAVVAESGLQEDQLPESQNDIGRMAAPEEATTAIALADQAVAEPKKKRGRKKKAA